MLPFVLFRTIEEVRWRQLDIILQLAIYGVPLVERDRNGLTASHLACEPKEEGEKFLEGAILLGEEKF